MSVRATNWAWEHGRAGTVKGGELLTLVRVADHADDDGICWPGEKAVASYTGQDERTVRRHLKKMEDDRLLHRERQDAEKGRGRGHDRIFLHLDQADILSGGKSGDLPDIDDASTGHLKQVLPDNSDTALYREPPEEPSGTHTEGEQRDLPSVGRKKGTPAEYALASEIVAAFNQAAGTAVTVDAHLTPIVGRIREKPDLTAEDHRGIIAAVFAVPWWSGAPGPNVIYGNAAQFERSIETWRAAPKAVLRAVEPEPDPADFASDRERFIAEWPGIAERLRNATPDSTYRLWLEPMQPLGATSSTVLLGAPEGIKAWSERRYTCLIEEALRDHGAGWSTVEFRIIPDDLEAAA